MLFVDFEDIFWFFLFELKLWRKVSSLLLKIKHHFLVWKGTRCMFVLLKFLLTKTMIVSLSLRKIFNKGLVSLFSNAAAAKSCQGYSWCTTTKCLFGHWVCMKIFAWRHDMKKHNVRCDKGPCYVLEGENYKKVNS